MGMYVDAGCACAWDNGGKEQRRWAARALSPIASAVCRRAGDGQGMRKGSGWCGPGSGTVGVSQLRRESGAQAESEARKTNEVHESRAWRRGREDFKPVAAVITIRALYSQSHSHSYSHRSFPFLYAPYLPYCKVARGIQMAHSGHLRGSTTRRLLAASCDVVHLVRGLPPRLSGSGSAQKQVHLQGSGTAS